MGENSSYGIRESNIEPDTLQAVLESNGRVSEYQAYSLVTRDLEKLLGIRGIDDDSSELVVFEGGSMFNITSKVAAIISPTRGLIDIF